MTPITAIIMIGPGGSGELVQKIAAARSAAAADSAATLLRWPGLQRLVIAQPAAEPAQFPFSSDARFSLDPDPPDQVFHFGQRLTQLIHRYQLGHVLYLGAGSQPLLPETELRALLDRLAATAVPTLITNNVHSADWVAFNCASRLSQIAHWLDRDNMLAWRLRHDLNYEAISLPPSGASRLDIDTPFDLQVLALQPALGPKLRAYLQTIEPALGLSRVRQAAQILQTPGSRVTLIGRVATEAVERLGARQLWTRVFAEERGMVANRRQAEGHVFSFIADQIERTGAREFVAQLTDTSDLVLFDTRVYMAHHRRWPTAEERFASDLGLAGKISDARLRRLTEAVAEAPIPILLGGHNVVSGGVYALLEIAK